MLGHRAFSRHSPPEHLVVQHTANAVLRQLHIHLHVGDAVIECCLEGIHRVLWRDGAFATVGDQHKCVWLHDPALLLEGVLEGVGGLDFIGGQKNVVTETHSTILM